MQRIEIDVNDLIDRILKLDPEAKVSTAMLASWRNAPMSKPIQKLVLPMEVMWRAKRRY